MADQLFDSLSQELIKKHSLIFRIIRKDSFGALGALNKIKDVGTTAEPAALTGLGPQNAGRWATQIASMSGQQEIARFTFPINRDGYSLYYQSLNESVRYRVAVQNGVAGAISEMYGKGISDLSMSGVFSSFAERNVILSTDFLPDLTTYTPRDWARGLKDFCNLYADLHDPFSKIWSSSGFQAYYMTRNSALVSELSYGKPNAAGYEFQVIDEYARSIYAVEPEQVELFADAQSPMSFGWKLPMKIIEDKMDAIYRAIPEDVMDMAALFKMPRLDELPILGPLTDLFNKLIAIENTIIRVVDVILSWIDSDSRAISDLARLHAAEAQRFNRLIELRHVLGA